MAYQSSIAEARKILDAGIAAQGSSGANLMNGGAIFHYCSSHAGADILGAGFFSGAGAQVHHSSGAVPFESVARSTRNVGMRPGDVLLNIESSAGATPGKVTWHGAIATSLASGGGAYNVTVASA